MSESAPEDSFEEEAVTSETITDLCFNASVYIENDCKGTGNSWLACVLAHLTGIEFAVQEASNVTHEYKEGAVRALNEIKAELDLHKADFADDAYMSRKATKPRPELEKAILGSIFSLSPKEEDII